MQVEIWDITRPRPYKGNPRKLPEKAIKKVAGSIKAFGFRSPIVVDEQGVILAGHTRLEAAKHLRLRNVPVHVAAGLSEAQAKAYRLADNRVAQETDWLEDALKLELDTLTSLGFDLDLTGFDVPELNRLLHSDEDVERAEETPEPPAIPVSMPGDLWLLGDHRLLCGDATVATDVETVLGRVKPHLMVTDPPYGVQYDASFRNGMKRGDGSIVSARAVGKVLNDHNADWRDAWALFPGDVAYIWHAARFANVVHASLDACGFGIRAQIIWAKNQLAIGRGDYHWQHEPCWYAVREKAKGHWQGDRKQSTLWKIDKPLKSETGHSTQKPIDCMKRPIENNSSIGQAVYEPFSGSGTRILAGELTGRRVHAIELNPAYVDVAVLRWQDYTGQHAVHEATAKTYEELKDARSVPAKNTGQARGEKERAQRGKARKAAEADG
jgi:DNA modification methylase